MSPRVLLKINVAVNLGALGILPSDSPTWELGHSGWQSWVWPGRRGQVSVVSETCARGEARAHCSSDGLAKALSSTMSVIMEKRKHRAQPANTYLRSTYVCQNDHLPTWHRGSHVEHGVRCLAHSRCLANGSYHSHCCRCHYCDSHEPSDRVV